MRSGPLPRWCEDTCAVCPAQELGPGEFDVVDRPGREFAYNPEVGWRTDSAGVAVCVHPYRVGMPAGRYASGGVPLPDLSGQQVPPPSREALEFPESADDLEGWLVATLRVVKPAALGVEVARAEVLARRSFPAGVVTDALRRVLSRELTRR
jgi:hypothetical protein